ncbi:MAG TPA: FG-GAP-like repeat-containing protein [Gemmataceae bacterium]|nr:FG-GAP-like repeat-containing protein [Gemmataceae bacterium]
MLSRMLARESRNKVCGRWYRPQVEALEERALLSTDTWTGNGGANAGWSNPANWDQGVAPAPGDDLVFPLSFSQPVSSVNDLSAGMTFHSIGFVGFGANLYLPALSGNPILLTGGMQNSSQSQGAFQPPPTAHVDFNGITLGAGQTFTGVLDIKSPFNLNGFTLNCSGGLAGVGPYFEGPVNANGSIIGGAIFVGPVTLSAPSSFVGGDVGLDIVSVDPNGFVLTLDGSGSVGIRGSGSVIKNGTGTWDNNLNSINYTGSTIVNAGTLRVSGTMLGPVNVVGGTLMAVPLPFVSPPGPPAGPSLMTGPLTFSSGATFQVNLNGPTPGTNYSQLLVNGPADLGGATLSASISFSSVPVAFVIMESPDSISGTFNGLPEGAPYGSFQIHYFNSSPGFPARVVLANDPKVTYTSVTWSQNTFPQTPLLTAAVANVGGNPVNGAAPSASGTVIFKDGLTTLGDPIQLVNGVATLTPLLTAGTHSITAIYNPSDSTFLTSTSVPVNQVINPVDMGWRDVMTGDFNGDGKQDIVGRTAIGQWWVGLSDGSSFSNQLWTTWNEAAGWRDVHVGDFNGDGKPDIAGRTAWGDWWVAISTGSSFTNSLWGHWNPNVTWVDVKVGDFNGDGKTGIVGRYLQAGQWWMAQSTGSSFTNSLWATWNPAATWVDVQAADFDGDKKTDLTGRYLEGCSWWTALSTGSSFVTTMWASWNPAATWVDVKAGDFDGDGKADLTGRWLQGGQWWTAISTGSSFTTALWASWNPNVTWVDVQVGDFNGDGKADLAGRWLQGGQWWTAISTGSSFTNGLWASWNPNVTWVDSLTADFTGDGKADLTSRYQQGGQWWSAASSGSDFATSLWTTWPA